MITDTHAHLDYKDYDEDRDVVVARAKEAGVSKIITIGIGKDSIPKTLSIAEKYPQVYASVGVHPTDLEALPLEDWTFLEKAAEHPKVVAIGETGLDHHHIKSFESAEDEKIFQRDYFLKQLELAKKVDKPVIIHCREAYEDTLTILEEFGKFRKEPGVIHCFGSDERTAQWAFNLGYYISVGGILTFKTADLLRQVITWMPKDRLLLETDCPYLTPMPNRGKRNEPAYTFLVAEKVSELWDVKLEKAAEQTTENATRLFGI